MRIIYLRYLREFRRIFKFLFLFLSISQFSFSILYIKKCLKMCTTVSDTFQNIRLKRNKFKHAQDEKDLTPKSSFMKILMSRVQNVSVFFFNDIVQCFLFAEKIFTNFL